jgi:ATP/maltotriose-dependent transcriptional regulator MalT/DNA-binding SARP family transcriptional activator
MAPSWRELTSARRARWPVVRGALTRPRLHAPDGAQVITVVAPAGYSKTTTLATADLRDARAWLTLDADDADPQVFVAGLSLAVEQLPGGHGPAALMDAGTPPRRVAAKVADVLDASRALLVIDEAHHLGGGLLDELLRELLDCGQGQVALLSRVPLSLTELTRLDAAGVLAALGVEELTFTPEELGALFAAQGVTLSRPDLQHAHALTEGWPIAVRYLAQACAQGRVQLARLSDLDGGPQLATLFTYLAQEVLGPLDPALRDVLVSGSLFEDLTPALLRDVLGLDTGGELLEALSRSGTFLTRQGEGAYRAHPLLRAHLRAQLPPGEVVALAARGAAHHEALGHPRRAMAAHFLAGNTDRAAALLIRHGPDWLRAGRLSLVEKALERLPAAAWTAEVHALSGDRHRLASRYPAALHDYARSGDLQRALGEAQVALDTVQPDLGWDALARAEALAAAHPEGAAMLAQVRRMRAENLLNAGRLAEATALEPDLQRSARYALRSGDLDRALQMAEDAARGEVGGARAAQNHREGLLLSSLLHAATGAADIASARARDGLREGERLDSPFVRALALARLGHADLTVGALDTAQAHYEAAQATAQPVTQRLQTEALMGLAYLAERRGESGRARDLHEQALAASMGDAYMRGLLHLMYALAALHAGHPDAGRWAAARAAFLACGDAFGLAAVALGEAASLPAGTVTAPEAVQAAARYPFLLTRRALSSPFPEGPRRAQLLARLAADHPALREALLPLAAALGYAQLPLPADTPGFGVQVQVLGRVAVTRLGEGRPRDWGRAKARDLLLLLAAHVDGVPREQAQELLFPDADPGVGERNFRVTLHALGQVLEEGAPSGVFLERGDWVRLRGGPDLHVDLWAAQRQLQLPAGTPGRLDALLDLPGALADSELPPVQEVAAAYAAQLPDALCAEALLAVQEGQAERAVGAAGAVLALDPAHEPAARLLMRLHKGRGHGAAARRVYAQLEVALKELGLTPSEETAALAGRLLA